MSIDPAGPTPVYRQLADIIAARIEAGDLELNRPIPTEVYLVQEYGLARETVRRAVRELRHRGLVFTVQGKGTFVAPPA